MGKVLNYLFAIFFDFLSIASVELITELSNWLSLLSFIFLIFPQLLNYEKVSLSSSLPQAMEKKKLIEAKFFLFRN